MKIEYFAGGKRTVEAEDVAVLQTNTIGGFTIFSQKPKSRYEGVFFENYVNNQHTVFKTIEQLALPGNVTKITHTPAQTTREYDNGLMETIAMPDRYPALIYKLNKQVEVGLVLDCREIFDNKQWGRTYALSVDHKCLVITFTKKNDSREPNGKEYQVFVAVFGEGMQYLPVQQWVEHSYALDQERNSWPFSRWVFDAAKMRIKEAVIAFSTSRSHAIETAINVYAQRDALIAAKEKRIAALTTHKLRNPDLNVSYTLAVAALDALRFGHGSHYAGLPWFVQPWTRDELIATGADIITGNFPVVKNIIGTLLTDVKGATLTRFPGVAKELPAADGMGWLFFRLEQFIAALEKERKLKTFLSSSEMDVAEDKLDTALNALFKDHVTDGLIVNGPEETWMDTSFGGDKRDGARIEIQALTLAMLRFHHTLGSEDPREATLRTNVRKHFFTGKTLKDGKEDPNIRPNCFLASFLYPQLLSKKEWEACFDTALKKLWLDWGGLSTIAKDHPLYCNDHTGENPKSYHRGDSWFWVNNLAAIAMHRVNAKKYSPYINKILKASMHEQQAMGIAGACGELSSASRLRSQGCWSQLWSNATLVELLREIS
ncbi:MAG TPA: amylo-alpha-1,6-glucosidase [Candidatus Binatia bacterium]|nr:amylo-alpha-1,6-glucosidase [Candidatus Binatia bacterium]